MTWSGCAHVVSPWVALGRHRYRILDRRTPYRRAADLRRWCCIRLHRSPIVRSRQWYRSAQGYGAGTLTLIVVLLVVWVVIAALGFVVKGLFWLAIVGIVLFLATLAFGAIKRRVKS